MDRFKSRTHLGLLAAALTTGVVGLASKASADSVSFDLTSANAAIFPPYTGSYASVSITLTSSTTAAVKFDGYEGVTYDINQPNVDYLMSDGSSVALDVNASAFVASNVAGSNSFTNGGFDAYSLKNINYGSQQVDGRGSFNLTIDAKDGFKMAATEITFNLTNSSGTWASASDVLVNNSLGNAAAAHIYVATDPAVQSAGALTTGYAGGTSISFRQAPTPLPASVAGGGVLFALLGLAGLRTKAFHLRSATD
jgi:hypothetical protein